jgi:hypothetical protein
MKVIPSSVLDPLQLELHLPAQLEIQRTERAHRATAPWAG